MIRFLHAADFHLDSPFAALSEQRAAARRRESRELPRRICDYVNQNGVDLVLLSGDLLDSASPYRETADALRKALGEMRAKVFIAPGNHDWYGENSPYAQADWPSNVYIFRSGEMTCVPVPELNAAVCGAAFTGPEQSRGLLTGFAAPEDGRVRLGVLHGELDAPGSRYDPVTREEIAGSHLAYLALGHIHRRAEPLRCGGTAAAWPGCPEGRGFDELGEKGFYDGTVDGGEVRLRFVPFARHRYEILQVDVTGREVAEAVEAALPADTAGDLYRIVLTGETDERGAEPAALTERFSGRFDALEFRDHTRLAEDIWARAGEDTLRGLFLRGLRERLHAAQTETEREKICLAARFGLAALDHRDVT